MEESREDQQDRPIETAREAAKHCLRSYFGVNETIGAQEVSRHQVSVTHQMYVAHIGPTKGHRIARQQMIITRVGDGDCSTIFEIADIVAEIRDEQRGYNPQSLMAVFGEQERVAQAEREEEEERQRTAAQRPAVRPAIFRSYNAGFCKNCGEWIGYIEVDGGRTREYCNNNNKCKMAHHRAQKREEKRAAILRYNSELRDFWYENKIEGQLLTMLQEILFQHGKKAALAATNAVLFARKEQVQIMGLAHQYTFQPRPPRP